jgi:hypothetical protein
MCPELNDLLVSVTLPTLRTALRMPLGTGKKKPFWRQVGWVMWVSFCTEHRANTGGVTT